MTGGALQTQAVRSSGVLCPCMFGGSLAPGALLGIAGDCWMFPDGH